MITLPSTLTTVDQQHGYRSRGPVHGVRPFLPTIWTARLSKAVDQPIGVRPIEQPIGVRPALPGACSGSASLGVRDYTVRLKFGSIPYSDKDAANTTHTIAASEARIDCPTAVPTPTGPPLA